eukprot:CAMPEP_0170633138 /NCGR_PEP_ID=MMETSP0224-20130122/35768_1 /TAXON_ID=285029 /ORGANISM="Togula jolla, Strain CCCM 725" /LENGTH=91 /DNA_ID=CAMNT_0010962031 /DNA_START=107 /DNA_END=382 /DNA_ORIENTATION=-
MSQFQLHHRYKRRIRTQPSLYPKMYNSAVRACTSCLVPGGSTRGDTDAGSAKIETPSHDKGLDGQAPLGHMCHTRHACVSLLGNPNSMQIK